MRALIVLVLLFSLAHLNGAQAGLFERERTNKTCQNFSPYSGARELCLLAPSREHVEACKKFSKNTSGRLACINLGKPIDLIKACGDLAATQDGKVACLKNSREVKDVERCKKRFPHSSQARIYCLKHHLEQ